MAEMKYRQPSPGPMVDPLDLPDYDPVKHLSLLFPHPSTFASIPPVAATLHTHVDTLSSQISDLVVAQAASNEDTLARIEAAQKDLTELFAKIENVGDRARKTEEGIAGMTAEIKKLDNTKRNLTVSMTVLKRLQMLTTAYEQLRNLGKSRQYKECAQLLQAVIQLMAHFKSYRSINQIAVLNRNVADLERELLEQVCEDFELVFAKAELPQKAGMLAEACLVMEALGEPSKNRLITWYCNTQLREYRQVFRGSEEAGSLDNISRRYAWLKRILKTYDEEHAQIFPALWKVNEVLATTFCDNTKDDFKGILARSTRGRQLDVNLLLSCLQETLELEQWLDKRFGIVEPDRRKSADTAEERPHGFGQSISGAFEPYLNLWVEAQDRQLTSMIAKYRANPLSHTDEDLTSTSVLPSSIDLFHFYRLSFSQCATLSTGTALLELARTFAKHLDSYAETVLQYLLTQPIGVLEIVVILNTADYCSVTSGQLGSKIASRISPLLQSNISFESQQDSFLGVVSSALKTLVALSGQPLEHPIREMKNMPWARMGIVGDSSSYVTEMVRVAQDQGFKVLSLVSKDAYARAYSERLAEYFATQFLSAVVAVKPITEIAAEQLLLDLYSLKKSFEELLSLSPLYSKAQDPTPLPASYNRHLQVIFSRATALLKTLQLPTDHPTSLIQAFLLHHSTRSRTALSRFLELKGIKTKTEQAPFLEAFSVRIAEMPEQERVMLSGDEHWLATLGSEPLKETIVPKTNALEGVGRALLNRARDGVDRLGKEDGDSVSKGFGRFFTRP